MVMTLIVERDISFIKIYIKKNSNFYYFLFPFVVDDRDEDERAFDQILSMSTTKRMIAPQQKVATIKR